MISVVKCSYSSLQSLVLFLLFALLPGLVCAQESSAQARNGKRADKRVSSDWQRQVGAVVLFRPEYEGSDRSNLKAFPLIALEYKRRVFINFINGVGLYLANSESVKLGAGIAYAFGRDENDSVYLQGMGDIDDGAALNLFADYKIRQYSLGVKYNNRVWGGDAGATVDVTIGYSHGLSRRSIVKYAVVAGYGDSEHMASFFGVNETQSSASGLDGYAPGRGLKSTAAQLGVFHLLSKNWSMRGQLEYKHLVVDAADSPLVKDKDRFSVIFGVAYRL